MRQQKKRTNSKRAGKKNRLFRACKPTNSYDLVSILVLILRLRLQIALLRKVFWYLAKSWHSKSVVTMVKVYGKSVGIVTMVKVRRLSMTQKQQQS